MSLPPRPAPAAPRHYHFPDVTRASLANGLQLRVVALRRLPLATVLLSFDAGAECDTPADAGTAALTAQGLAEGTVGMDAVQLTDAFEQLGASLDTAATWTQMECSTTVLAPHLPRALQLLAGVGRHPAFPEQEITRLREERLADLLQQRSEPRGLADDMFARLCFRAESRYAYPEAGDEPAVQALSRANVELHHARFVAPSRGTLVVVGDVEPETVRRLANEQLGSWQVDAAAPPAVSTAAQSRRAVHLIRKDEAPQTELRIGLASVPRVHPDFHALAVMNAILGGLFNSRINLNLRERHAYTYGAFSRFDWRRSASLFEVSTAVHADATGHAVREVLDEIDRMRSELVSPAELSLAVDYLTGVFPLRFETTAAIADALALQESFGLAADYYDTYRERVAAVQRSDVLRVAQTHLRPKELMVVAVGEPATMRAALEPLGLGAVHEYEASGRRTTA